MSPERAAPTQQPITVAQRRITKRKQSYLMLKADLQGRLKVLHSRVKGAYQRWVRSDYDLTPTMQENLLYGNAGIELDGKKI
jgi:hypothetical protein